jgi:ribosomal protein L27
MARASEPLHRPGNIVLRIRGHQATQDAQVVRFGEDRPLFAFAGLRTPWRGVRGAN